MASLVAPDVVCVAGKTEEFLWSAYQADGKTPQGITLGDVVRFKLADGIGSNAPTLDLSSNAPTANGSQVFIDQLGATGTTPASGRVRLAQADTQALTGKKYWELDLVDHNATSPA